MIDSMEPIIIGVDGGGTGCRAAIGTPSRGILAQAKGGRANVSSDPDLALRNVVETIALVAKNVGFSDTDLNRATAHLGLAGVNNAEEGATLAASLPYAKATVTDDRATAVTGALGGEDGYLLSIGTGTIAALNRGNKHQFISGWGFQISDQASGAWLGRATLERILLCFDGLNTHSPLTDALLARFDNDPTRIVSFAARAKPGDFATFAPEIVEHAREGDPWGKAIMSEGAAFLMRCLSQLGFQPGDKLCLSGGVGPHYRSYFPEYMLAGHIGPCGSALEGAFQLAQAAFTAQSEETS